ncbi:MULTISPECIES: hypothetical protein [Sporosarcina]|uniref:Uncharacterized protein n=1 Tax=Sporosarcina saromensis TaxID=359365 RepID=A0ABU4G652_9BACL|nr:hypothetical protein [Sporosarcina saromensis]MDW0112453.1 hypothetical protein [Sporosarcina saromensis]
MKMPMIISMLVIGSIALVLSITLPVPKTIQWILLIIAVLLNVTSAVTLMVIGVKRTRGTA